jgi:hypothetical protein
MDHTRTEGHTRLIVGTGFVAACARAPSGVAAGQPTVGAFSANGTI